MNRTALATGLVVLLAGTACDSPVPLANTRNSPEALATAVLDAVARGDRMALEALALNEQEFRYHVWPDLPAARPERNLPFSYVWGDLHQKSDGALTALLQAHGGRTYTLIDVAFDGETKYASYDVRRAATFRVRDASGAEMDLRVSGSMREKDGAWKVFSFVVDD